MGLAFVVFNPRINKVQHFYVYLFRRRSTPLEPLSVLREDDFSIPQDWGIIRYIPPGSSEAGCEAAAAPAFHR